MPRRSGTVTSYARGDGAAEADLLYIDLHLVHEVTSPQAFEGLRLAGRRVRRPDLTIATADHNVPTTTATGPVSDPVSRRQLEALDANCAEFGVTCYPMGDENQGIVHVIGPEQGLTQPGMTIVCGDSHTSTHGAFGCLAFGIGTSEVEHVLATQTLPQRRPRTMAVTVDGDLPLGVSAKDLVLAIIGRLGTTGGVGYVVEYRGSAIRSLSMEGRMTVCNMSIEAGARAGMIAPDDVTFEYLRGPAPRAEGRGLGPGGRGLASSWPPTKTPRFDAEVVLDAASIRPQVSWGTNPAQVVPIDGAVPSPDDLATPAEREAAARALVYMGLEAGTPIRSIDVDTVFIGSCTNSRIEDLRTAAGVLEGRRVRPGLRALVVPGLTPGQAPGRGGGPRPRLRRGGLRVARERLLDVPRHEPRSALGRRALRLDLEPQFRGPPGARRPHPSRVARRGGGDVGRRAVSPPRRTSRAEMEPVHIVSGPGGPARPLGRRHRPDHPERVAEAHRADRLRRRSVRRVARRPGLRPQRPRPRRGDDPRRRPELRHRVVARARRVGPCRLRLPGRREPALRRHLPQQLHPLGPRACRGLRARTAGRSWRPLAPTRRSRSSSTSTAAWSRSRRPGSRRRSGWTTTPATGCCGASTTSA